LVEAREISPVELTSAVLERIAAHDRELNAYISVGADEAMASARECESEIAAGKYRGLLHGIPISVKDNLAVAGWPTTNGSALMRNNVTDYDASVVRHLRKAGAIILGKNAMHEWAMGGTCTATAFGTVRNPWNLAFIPGGSSGGSAAAVSASLAFAAIGTDGMGSIRMPAAYCGVVGMKPTYGLVSRFGELPPTSSWIDHIGPITKDVRDARSMLSAMAHFDPFDPTSARAVERTAASNPEAARRSRIGIVTNYFQDDLVPEARRRFESVIERMQTAGYHLKEVTLESLQHLPLTHLGVQSERESFLLPFALRGEGFASEDIRFRVLSSAFVTARDYHLALRLRSRIREEFLQLMESVDVLLTPVTSSAAFQIGSEEVPLGEDETPIDLRIPGSENRVTCRLTYPFNVVGAPAVSIPTGPLDSGLPFGIQLVAAPFRDFELLDVAEAVEGDVGMGYQVPPRYGATEHSSINRP
jgi:aspartyl-tRNA(Asn)/glutamyl-tRNA(Gln) amidotransferase subunit A